LTAAFSLGQTPVPDVLPPPTPIVVPVVPALPAPPMVPARPITLAEFAATFKPAPGTYEIVFLHSRKKCPVTVCFTLPDCGCPKVCVGKHSITFDYGTKEVEIRFKLFGKVAVVTH
jgi:hypothetical protein